MKESVFHGKFGFAVLALLLCTAVFSSCKKEENRGYYALSEFSKSFIPDSDTIHYKSHLKKQMYKLAINSYYTEVVSIESGSKYHEITALIDHCYLKYTSPDYHIIYHFYIEANEKSVLEKLKVTIINRETNASKALEFCTFANSTIGSSGLISSEEMPLLGQPLIEDTYFVNVMGENIFLMKNKGILNYKFERLVWNYDFEQNP